MFYIFAKSVIVLYLMFYVWVHAVCAVCHGELYHKVMKMARFCGSRLFYRLHILSPSSLYEDYTSVPIARQETDTWNVRFKDTHCSCDARVKRPPLPLQRSFHAHGGSDWTLEHSCWDTNSLPGEHSCRGRKGGSIPPLPSRSHGVHLIGSTRPTPRAHLLCLLNRLLTAPGSPSIVHFLLLPFLCLKPPLL